MIAQHPIYGAIISLFIIFLVITESIQKEKLYKNRLVLSFVNLALFVMLIFYFDTYIVDQEPFEDIYIVYSFVNYFVFLLCLWSTFKNAVLKASHYQTFVNGIKNSQYNAYYVVDTKERIKDISVSLLTELNLEKEDAVGKKLFQVFGKKIRFTHLNTKEIDNRTLQQYYDGYKKQAKPTDQIEQELHFLNFNGEVVILQLLMQPIYVLGKYRGRMCVGQKKTDFDLLAVEKESKQKDVELESIRHKFIATLELSDEGIFSIDLNEKTIWLNDILKEQLSLSAHTLSLDDYRSLIEPSDLSKYLNRLNDLTVNKQVYQTSYRILVDGQYIWIKEKGKRLFEDRKQAIIMGIINPLRAKHFRKTDIDVLDQMPDENHLMVDLKTLIKSQRAFQLAVVSLKNIPEINEKHGRQIGNMMMGHYMTRLRAGFVTESSNMYRLSGLEFAFTMTDPRKMSDLKQGLTGRENFLNMSMEFGSISADLEVYIGIANMYDDAVNAQDLYQNAYRALKTAQLPQYKGNGCYFKDVK